MFTKLDDNATHKAAQVAYILMVEYAEANPLEEEDIWDELTTAICDCLEVSDTFAYEDVVRLGTILNPDIADDDAEVGQFAWLLDSWVDEFGLLALAKA